VEGTAGSAVDQAFIRHVAKQRLQLDLVIAGKAEGAGDLPLACG
jgi:hypothetical protein